MLSIVTRGNGASAQVYYEHLEPGKDRGIDDYYIRNEQGRWLGQGAEALGLSGEVQQEEFQSLAFGYDPKTGKPLVQKAGDEHRSGWDLTFSSPKSVSIAWALGDRETQLKIQEAHDRAVESALSYMERNAAFCRSRHGGKEELRADLACGVYQHYSSREQDPQIHSHVFVFNVGVGEDGKIRTLEGSHFFEWKMAGGAAYRVALAREMQDVGYTVLPDGNSFRLKEIAKGLERVFSKRRAQIEAILEARGSSGARASEVATLASRKKKMERTPEELRSEWCQRAEIYWKERSLVQERILLLEQSRHEIESSPSYSIARKILFSQEINCNRNMDHSSEALLRVNQTLFRAYQCLLGSDPNERVIFEWALLERSSKIQNIATAHLEVEKTGILNRWENLKEKNQTIDPERWIASLNDQRSTFSVSQVHAKIFQNLQGKMGLDKAENMAEEALSGKEIIRLMSKPGRDRYTTREMQQLEREMLNHAQVLHGRMGHTVRDLWDEEILGKQSLTEEQAGMLRVVVEGSDISLVQGWAGTGKSYALGVAREVWEREGYRVRGAALSGKAAMGLSTGSGIASVTIAALEREVGKQGTDPLTARDILVIDEAGMMGSRKLCELLSLAEKANAKIVLVGDKRQLPAIEAGGSFRVLQERLNFSELSQIQRQISDLDRQAVRDLALGRAEEALENLGKRDRVHEYKTGRSTKEGIGEIVSRDLLEGKVSMAVVATREDVRDINEWARFHAKAKGLVDSEGLWITTNHGDREFSRGDRVLFTRNDRALGVMNGDFGTVQKIGKDIFCVQLDRGGSKEVDSLKYAHLEYGYAATCHKLQGATVDRCHVYASENGMGGREWAYVAASRAREAFHIHAEKITLRELAPEWTRSHAKDTTLDYEGEEGHERGFNRDLSGVRRHLRTAKDLVRRIDEAIGHLGKRYGLKWAISFRYAERSKLENRSLDLDRSKELLISVPEKKVQEKSLERNPQKEQFLGYDIAEDFQLKLPPRKRDLPPRKRELPPRRPDQKWDRERDRDWYLGR